MRVLHTEMGMNALIVVALLVHLMEIAWKHALKVQYEVMGTIIAFAKVASTHAMTIIIAAA
eukprot:CAMPEP_0202954622 /NCGR_PEP_ID=MMETSP1395-20130829/50977_1 /ASSEMBLY_ACC=CAM_ASM_000871 /TAXON_ID=5961 /ORGANISM="Blepharisma japonicum, Strain Stock R1072" /LENGTH=60 /DNA_ID=CAMNT_0049670297 /DNA_START=709 /DNA_END=891 /DNA_ORIENTATION=-